LRDFERIFWIVLDSVGIGELPDAADYGDVDRNTLGHVAESRALKIPNLVQLGLANIAPLKHQAPAAAPLDRTLGNGGSVARPGVPCLQEWIPKGIDRGV
jgi:phosphopentomutase